MRLFKTKTGNSYSLLDNGTVENKSYNLGRGFYLSKNFIEDYFIDLKEGMFGDSDQKNKFMNDASDNMYNRLEGRVVFFNPKNPLKLELSSRVVNVEPEFDSAELDGTSGESFGMFCDSDSIK